MVREDGIIAHRAIRYSAVFLLRFHNNKRFAKNEIISIVQEYCKISYSGQPFLIFLVTLQRDSRITILYPYLDEHSKGNFLGCPQAVKETLRSGYACRDGAAAEEQGYI
jgi:hypothetical protein